MWVLSPCCVQRGSSVPFQQHSFLQACASGHWLSCRGRLGLNKKELFRNQPRLEVRDGTGTLPEVLRRALGVCQLGEDCLLCSGLVLALRDFLRSRENQAGLEQGDARFGSCLGGDEGLCPAVATGGRNTRVSQWVCGNMGMCSAAASFLATGGREGGESPLLLSPCRPGLHQQAERCQL